ncbi:MAG: SusC/RagA family TonB-linked outer membrane protein [Sediminibacterium sp.]|nr:SusC/RagA family TonB-linked outer membrane protein [Sediminibacterium sp.]
MRKFLGLLMVPLLLWGFIASAQTRTIKGQVVSATDGKAVAGATISVNGQKVSAIASEDGTFTVNASGNVSLTVKSVGFANQTVSVAGTQSSIKVSLTEESSQLNEIVVTGYSSQKRKEITGSVSVVSVKDMKAVPSGTAEQMLQGQASGVTIIGSGSPGEGSTVFIRGITSFGNATPLVIVDGVQSAPGDLGSFRNLSANDIESVQVLKDGQAAIYGARGAAGVIIVTTKRGKGKPTITYDSYSGIQVPRTGNVWNKLDPQGMADLAFLAAKNSGQVDAAGNVSSGQYGTGKVAVLPDFIKAGSYSGVGASSGAAALAATNLALYNNDYSKGPIHLIVPANKKGTDWWDEIFDPAPMTSHSITASGGQDKSSYLFSLNYFDQKGTLLNTYLKRYSMRANTSWNIKDNIRIGENLQLFYKDNPRIGNNERGNAVNNTAWEQPIIPVYDAGGGFGGTAGSNLGNSSNPVANQVRAKDNVNHNWQIQGNVFAEVDFAKNFTARTVFGGNLDNYYGFYHNYRNYENAENPASNGYGEYSGYNNNWNFTNTLSYANTFKQDHSIKLMAGYEALKVQGRQVGGSRVNYFSDDLNYLSLNTGSPIGQNNYSNLYKTTTNSILAKVDYAFRDKYLVGLNGRRDGSSVFGPNTKFGNFWSASAAWVISNEDFFKNVKFVNTLKLRGSYGLQGSIANVGSLNQYTLYGGGGGSSYYDFFGTSNTTVMGFYATNLGNLSTGWEKSKTLDFGFEATVLNNKLDISFDWYKKTIEGLLFQDQAPAVVGVGSSLPQVNIGDMQNTGIDLSLNYRGKINNDVSYTVGANLGAYKNEIINIPGSAGFFETAYTHSSGPQIRNAIGQPVSAFFGYKIAGIFQSAAEVASYAKMVDAAPGRFKYEDINKDGKISDDDRTFFGNPNPDFTLGINLNVAYKRFDISTNLYGSFGNEILNETRYFQDFLPSFQNSKSIPLLTESWLPTRPSKVWPIVENNSYFSTNGVINNFYVEDGTYMRVKQLSLGYTIDPATLKRYGIDKARVFVQGANLFTITNYSGLDPEVAGSTSSFGVDKGNYPPMKTFNVGISLTF